VQISVSLSRSSGLERLLTQFFTIFHKTAYGSEMWSARCLLFLEQTGSRHTILEVCGFRFWQFPKCACHVFPRIVTKIRTDLKLICTTLYRVSTKPEIEIDIYVQNPTLAVSRLWWTYFHTEEYQFWPFRGCI